MERQKVCRLIDIYMMITLVYLFTVEEMMLCWSQFCGCTHTVNVSDPKEQIFDMNALTLTIDNMNYLNCFF